MAAVSGTDALAGWSGSTAFSKARCPSATATGAPLAAAFVLVATSAGAATPVEVQASILAGDAQLAAGKPVRIVRFQAPMTGEFPERVAGAPFKLVGRVLPPAGSDPVIARL
jgi:hypothetical protein